jgi:hypothetical protein
MRYAASVVASLSLLVNCAGDLPSRTFVKDDDAVKQREAEWDNKPAIQTVHLPGRFFLSEPMHTPVPAAIGKRHLDITMPGGAATLDDLIVILENEGLAVSYSWENANNADDLGARRLPFRRFEGSVNDLLSRLQMGMSIASWWNNNTLYLAPIERYTVKVPQNDEVIGVVEGQLESLGAQDIVSSLYAGQVSYSASPEANDELIGPFLQRMALNLSEITMQVALVRVTMDEAARRGFDWSNFNLSLSKNVPFTGASSSGSGGSSNSSTSSTSSTTTASTTSSTSGFVQGSETVRPSGSQYQIGAGELTGLGSAQGVLPNAGTNGTSNTNSSTEGAAGVLGLINSVPSLIAEASVGQLNLTAAIGLLSEFGTTSTDQNVELRTLAGQSAHIRDGGETPYVSQITSNTTTGGNTSNASSSVQFETVDTGLTLDLTPNFDAASGIVTIDVSLEVEDIESFLQISAGAGNGDVERPVTSNRELTDLVRVPAGETVILGGVTKISKSDNRSAPLEYWSLGSDDSETDRAALFIILRPFVTVYEMDGAQVTPPPPAAQPAAFETPASPPKGTANGVVEQSLTKPKGQGQAPSSTTLPPAIIPNRPTGTAEPPIAASTTFANNDTGNGGTNNYFNSLVGKILVQPGSP